MYRKKYSASISTTNGFALIHDKTLQIHFLYEKRQASEDFLKDVEIGISQLLTIWRSVIYIVCRMLIM